MATSSKDPSLTSVDRSEGTDPSSALPQPGPGDVVGAYRLCRQLGRGAAGRVFEVEHVRIGRRAAMKILSPEHSARPRAVRRLLSEAQAVNQINHPHIVEITDVIEAQNGGPVNAVVMELLEGQSLAQALVKDGRLPPSRFVPIIIQVADALAAAHAAGFVHRDLKPENIFLTARDGQHDYVKLLDFGIAKSLAPDEPVAPEMAGPSEARAHLTLEGTFLGTPAYAAPEQGTGKAVDHRSDIYALGVILYELLCGRLPFEAQSLGEFLVKHITLPPPPSPPEVLVTPIGQAVDTIARRCLEKDPARRFRSAGEVREALAHWQDDVTLVRPSASQRPPVFGAVAVVVAIAGALGTSMLLRGGGRAPDRSVSPSAAAVSIAAAEPAAAGPGEEAAKKVVLTFHSQPDGAETRRMGSRELLGMTPFSEAFSPESEPVEFEMRKPGYDTARFRISLTADATVNQALRRVARAPARRANVPTSGSRAPPNREATLNPFKP